MQFPRSPSSALSRHAPAGRLLRWLLGADSSRELPEVAHAKLLTLREPVHVTLLAFFWTQAVAVGVWWVTGVRWAVAWLLIDVLLFALRVACSARITLAEVEERRLPARHVIVLHATWIGTISLGTALTVSQPDLRLMLLGTILPVGFCGYVVSRWQAFPRCAMLFIHMLWLGLLGGLLASPLPEVAKIAWLMPAGGAAFQVLLGLNHTILAGALRAQQENRRLSMHDPLTELPNRLMLRERLAGLCGRLATQAAAEPFAVLCLDLDGFKDVNDRYGHAAGDWLLKSVAERLRQAVRAQDVVCRVGGDEFVVLLPGAHEGVAVDIAERLLEAIARPHDLGGLATVPGRTSVGVALAPRDGTEPDRLLTAADDALYAAKRAGKGRWSVRPLPGRLEVEA